MELQVHLVVLEEVVGSQLKDYHTFLGLAMLQCLKLISLPQHFQRKFQVYDIHYQYTLPRILDMGYPVRKNQPNQVQLQEV